MRYSKCLASFCLVAFVSQSLEKPTWADGLDLSLTARAEAGIDPDTRNFLNQLPDVWAPQLKKIVTDTMNRVDTSVLTYIDAINHSISSQVINIQCHVVATERQVVDDLVGRLPWVRQAGPMEKLLDQIATYHAHRQRDSSPELINAQYDDLMLATSIVSCEGGQIPQAQADARRYISQFGDQWFVWNRVLNLGCKIAGDCPDLYRKAVSEIVLSADKRDLEASKAQATLDTYKRPNNPSRWQFWQRAADFDSIEDALTLLYKIENAVGDARAYREIGAIFEMQAAEKSLSDAKAKIDAALDGELRQNAMLFRMLADQGQRCNLVFGSAKGSLTQANASITAARKDLDTAFDTANIIKDNYDGDITLATALLKRTIDSHAFCNGA
jgi:hypothetical protein